MASLNRWPFNPWEKGMSSCYHPKEWRHMPCFWVERCGSCGAMRFTKEPFSQDDERWPAATRPPWPP